MDLLDVQLHGISTSLKKGDFKIPDIGDILPASLMLHELDGFNPLGCSYMNNWGCEHLGTSADEINALGEHYYERYFMKEETELIFRGMANYLAEGDFDKQYNFFQRVKLHGDNDYTWFYTVCKLVHLNIEGMFDNKLILLSSPVSGMDSLIKNVTKTLDQDAFIRNNYRKFAKLTRREKEIIAMVINGRSTADIAEHLFLSNHTVSTHRKNIINKTECKSFAELVRFAMVFNLVGAD
jgi:DNA-binding CsgD family transcriptional regulator